MQDVYTDYENLKEPTPIEQAYMQDWVFHYNIFTKLWNAIPRELYNVYWNNSHIPDVLKAKHLNVLLDLLHRCKGDVELIKEIAKDDLK